MGIAKDGFVSFFFLVVTNVEGQYEAMNQVVELVEVQGKGR